MNKVKKTLFVFEGENDEKKIFEQINTVLGFKGNNQYEVITIKTNLTKLYKDITNIFKSEDPIYVKESLVPEDFFQEYEEFDGYIVETYLLFDFEIHDRNLSYDKIEFLLNIFNNETEAGMLVLNFPMIESIYDYNNIIKKYNSYIEDGNFKYKKSLKVDAQEITIYRKANETDDARAIVDNNKVKISLLTYSKWDKAVIGFILLVNIYKVAKLLNIDIKELYGKMDDIMLGLFRLQHSKLDKIEPSNGEILVVSSFFVLILDSSKRLSTLLGNTDELIDDKLLAKMDEIKSII